MLKIDASQAKTFSQCPAKYNYQYNECLVKREADAESVHLRWGNAIHEGLELFTDLNSDYAAVKDKFRETFVELPGEELKTTEHGLLLLDAYLPYYRNNFSDWETLQNEEIGTMRLTPELQYIVKIDKVIKWRDNIYVVDYKTKKGARRQDWPYRFDLDIQPTGYVKWCKEKYGQCSGFIPVMMFANYRKRKYLDKPAGFDAEFDFTIVNRTQDYIKVWEREMLQLQDEIENNAQSGFWRKNPASCEFWKCEFKELCMSCDDEYVKDSLYEVGNTRAYLGE